MPEVEIEYCVPCGHLDRAIDVQRDLLESLGRDLEAVRLKTGEAGVFKVRVDEELVYDKAEEGFDAEVILARVEQRVADGA